LMILASLNTISFMRIKIPGFNTYKPTDGGKNL